MWRYNVKHGTPSIARRANASRAPNGGRAPGHRGRHGRDQCPDGGGGRRNHNARRLCPLRLQTGIGSGDGTAVIRAGHVTRCSCTSDQRSRPRPGRLWCTGLQGVRARRSVPLPALLHRTAAARGSERRRRLDQGGGASTTGPPRRAGMDSRPLGRTHGRGSHAALGCAVHGAGDARDMRSGRAITGGEGLDRCAGRTSGRAGLSGSSVGRGY